MPKKLLSMTSLKQLKVHFYQELSSKQFETYTNFIATPTRFTKRLKHQTERIENLNIHHNNHYYR